MLEDWTIYSWYCPNCKEEVAGLKNKKNQIRVKCKNPTDEKLERLDASHILGCIAWHFRRDHFIEGSLISDSIAGGHMLRLLKCYRNMVAGKEDRL